MAQSPESGFPFILKFNRSSYNQLTLLETQSNLRLIGKLAERQGRKVTGLNETVVAGLRHGCSFMCFVHLIYAMFKNESLKQHFGYDICVFFTTNGRGSLARYLNRV